LIGRFEDSGLADAPALKASLDLQILRRHPDQARGFVELVAEIAALLRGLTAASAPETLTAAGDSPLLINRLYQAPSTSRSEVWITAGAIATHWVDPFKDFLTALQSVEAGRLRRCPVCSDFFFATRKDRKACSRLCNAVRRVRVWRSNQSAYEYRRKLKRAGLDPARA
jgi:ribosomal protein S27AE